MEGEVTEGGEVLVAVKPAWPRPLAQGPPTLLLEGRGYFMRNTETCGIEKIDNRKIRHSPGTMAKFVLERSH